MSRYLISFNDGDMTFPDEDFPAVAQAVRTLRAEAMEAGAWVFGGGFSDYAPRVVDSMGKITVGPLQNGPVRLGGFSIIEVATDAQANEWARKIAIACRCSQEVRKFIDDSTSTSD